MNTLLISSVSFAGMGPYVSEIINSFLPDDPVYFLLIEDHNDYYSKNIKYNLLNKCTILHRKDNTQNKIKSLIYPGNFIRKILDDICKNHNIKSVHSLSSEPDLYKILIQLKSKYKLIYTVHDLNPHEAKKTFHKEIRQRILFKRTIKITEQSEILITNSQYQYKELKKNYPHKKIFFHEFPTLVTHTIKNGKFIPPELKGIKNYILFFGRIEYYKGIDLLYNVYLKEKMLSKNFKLVIAGNGDIYFPRKKNKEQNILFINRYIKDEEIAYLFKNAKCIVFPYISASQSGVLSLSCYFNVPILTSDVPYFQDALSYGIGITFKNGNLNDLRGKLLKICNSEQKKMIKAQGSYYKKYYSYNSNRHTLLTVYKS